MRIFLVILCLTSVAYAAEEAPVYWHFTGPLGPDVRAALAVERTDDDAHHLLIPDERDAYLAGVEMPATLGCLDDSGTCPSVSHGILRALGFGARISASGTKDGEKFLVVLRMTLVDGAQPKTFKGAGASLEEAARQAFVALHGQGTLTLRLSPADASFRLNDKPYGQGGGDYIVPAGKHTLLVEAPERRSVQQPIQIRPSERLRVTVDLPIAFGKISLQTNPPKAAVFLDGARWENPAKAMDTEPGERTLRVEAKGFRTVTKTVTIKPAIAHELSLKLVPKDPPWRTALRQPHRDTRNTTWTARGGLQIVSARGGNVNLSTSRSRDLESIDESSGLLGFEACLDWRDAHMMVTALSLSVQTGGAETKATLDGNIKSELDTVTRTVVRAGWVGARYSMWRFDAFATFGLGFVIEDIVGKTLTQEYEASDSRFVMGNELGLRYAFNRDWFTGISALFDYWPGERSGAVFTLNGGYAFNVPKGWF